MVKILEFGMTRNIGGIQTFLINFNSYLDKNNYSIDYACVYKDEKELFLLDKIKKLNAGIIKVPNYFTPFFTKQKELINIIKKGNYDVVHVNMNSACYMAPLIAAKKAGIKMIICHSHNASSDKGILKSLVHNFNKKRIPHYANIYFACSELAGKWFFSRKIRESNKYFFIPNTIESFKYEYNLNIREKIRSELSLTNNFVIGHIGRFSKQKNHKFIIEIFKQILQEKPDARLLLVGHGPLKEEIESLIEKENLSEKIVILSFRNDVHELLQAFDCFVMPSLYEGLPVTGLEAQAAGLPCFFSKEITRELQITANCEFLDIDNPQLWSCSIIKKCEGFVRKNCRNDIIKSGFDSENGVKYIETIINQYL